MLGAILTIAAIAAIAAIGAIGAFGYILCWKAGEADDRAEQEQKERYKNE